MKPRLALIALSLCACDWMPGKPDPEHRHLRPEEVTDFDQLYAQNCSGCHGEDGQGGAATPLSIAPYQVWATPVAVERAIAEGITGTAMPAFSEHQGGTLTSQQVAILAGGMRDRWAGAKDYDLPPYAARDGDPNRGERAYATFCASCHGKDGTGGKAGSVVNDSYLALVSEQGLRTTVVIGRPDLGMPNYRGYAEHPMPVNDVSDVVAWLWSKRSEFPGQLPAAPKASVPDGEE